MTFDHTLERFRRAVTGPTDEIPLARAALYVAQAETPDLDVDACERRLQDMADALTQQLDREPNRDHAPSIVRVVNRFLFTELGYRGNVDAYDDPANLLLDRVLSERIGIPVTLAIVYAEVCQRAGLDVQPIGLPGHVICRYVPADATIEEGILIDVFNQGKMLTEEDCQTLLRNIFGARVPFKPHYLTAMTPRQTIQRVLHNLKAGYLQRGDEERAARVLDLLIALCPWDLDQIRDRGMLRERLGEVEPALSDLEQYLQYRAGARDIQTVTETVRSLRRHRPGS